MSDEQNDEQNDERAKVKEDKQAFARAFRNVRRAVADGECSRKQAATYRAAWMAGGEIPEEYR